MAQTAATIYRDFVTDGVPSSGPHKVRKSDARTWGAWVEGIISAFTANGGLIYDTQANLFADLSQVANRSAWVVGDPIAGSNGIYRKLGASGSGSWVRVADLPYSFIRLSHAGGTANAIAATSSIPLPGASSAALLVMNVIEANTGPVTIAANGAAAKSLKTSSGNDLAAGYLTAGMMVAFVDVGSSFRLLSDVASAAIQAAAEAAAIVATAAKIDAQAAKVAAESAAGANLSNADSRATAIVTTIPGPVNYVRTAGYATAGDGGGALYKRVGSEPPHAGKFQSADGAWWELAEAVVTLQMFGAIGDGTADDTTAIQAAISYGRPIHWGNSFRNYRITDTIAHTLTSPLHWHSDGARIKFDALVSKREAFAIQPAGQNVFIEGILHLDANMKAFIGFLFESKVGYPDIDVHRLSVENIYRSSQAFTGGDGLWIRGPWRNVYVERYKARNMVMAAGAGVQGSYGIFGISISKNEFGYPKCTTVRHPDIDNVYCEDATYVFDQDGLRIMSYDSSIATILPDESTAFVEGGTFRNCRGRSIKTQTDATTVIGCKFIRTLANATGVGNPEIDIQTGGGNVIGIDFTYDNSVPETVVVLSGTYVPGKRMTGGSIRGVNGQISGSVHMPQLFTGVAKESLRYAMNISDVQVYADGCLDRLVAFNPNGLGYINLTNILVGVELAGIRLFSGGSLNVSMVGVRNDRPTKPLKAGITANITVQVQDAACSGWS